MRWESAQRGVNNSRRHISKVIAVDMLVLYREMTISRHTPLALPVDIAWEGIFLFPIQTFANTYTNTQQSWQCKPSY
jgi:hypothetical protein